MTQPLVINGSKIAKDIKQNIKNKIVESKLTPTLAVVFVKTGNKEADHANQLYTNMKSRTARKLGINVKNYTFASDLTQVKLLKLLSKLNNNNKIDGILVQLPLPRQINEQAIDKKIAPDKDVDGVNPINIGQLATGQDRSKHYYPIGATPTGIIRMLDYYAKATGDQPAKFFNGKKAVVLGRSDIVGRPLALMLINRGCETTVLNHYANVLSLSDEYLQSADIIISATGNAETVMSSDLSNSHPIIIDAGEDTDPTTNKLCGDVTKEAKQQSKAYSPVPHGVGPMCIAMVMENTLRLTEEHNK